MPAPTRRDFVTWSALGVAGLASPGRATPPAPPCHVRLAGGRRLAYREYGDPTGSAVVVYHHGLPGASREAEVFLPALAACRGVRLIAFDRPGFGGSDPCPGRTYRGWVCDLAAAADALGLSRFGLIGVSGGTPFSLAAAIDLPDRVNRVALGCPAGEYVPGRDNGKSAVFAKLAQSAPRLCAATVSALRRRVQRSHRHVLDVLRPLVPKECELFADPAAVEFVAAVLLDGLKQGSDATVLEAALLAAPWGLPLGRVAVPVTLWHGTLDRFVPPWKSERLAEAIPGAVRHLSPGDAHLSLPASRATELLSAAVGVDSHSP